MFIKNAFISARGGSKRLPGKNLKPFCGKPLIVWAIEHLKRVAEKVYVVTDSIDIGNVAKGAGAIYMHQPTEDCQHGRMGGWYAAKHFVEKSGVAPNEPIMSYLCTSPLVYKSDIDRMINAARELIGIPVILAAEMPELNCGHVYGERQGFYHPADITDGLPDGIKSDYVLAHIGVSVSYPEIIIKRQKRPVPAYAIKVKDWQQFDIDYAEDFELCELLYKNYILKGE